MKIAIVGCQRSGTTLMRLILNSHPKIHCCGEEDSYHLISSALNPETKKEIIGYQVPIWTELLVEYDSIKNMFKGHPVIFMIRNVLDVVASMKSLNGWLITEMANMRLWLTDTARRLKSKYGHYLDTDDPITWATVYWMYKTEFYFDMIGLHNIIGIKYDDLVLSPQVTISKLLQFLKLPWSDDVMRHHLINHGGTDNIFYGNNRGDRPIDCNSVGNWQKVLTLDEIDRVKAISNDLNLRLARI